MSNDIFKQWQQAKQEFGDEAYQRFNVTGTWSCNDDIEYELSWNPEGVALNTQTEQSQQFDIERAKNGLLQPVSDCRQQATVFLLTRR
jgi:hypothetical protein